MKHLVSLLRVSFNQRFGISAIRVGLREERGKMARKLLVFLLGVIGIGSLVAGYAWLVAQLFTPFLSLGMENVLLGIVALVSMITVFFFGLFYLIGTLYFSRDSAFLSALPIPQRTVFGAKFIQVLLGEMVTSGALLLPVLILFGVHTSAGALYYARALAVLLLAPCIPLSISGLLSLVLMRFTALLKRRELMTVIGSLALVVASFYVQFTLTSMLPEEMSAEQMLTLVSDNASLLQSVTRYFPPSGWAAGALLGDPGSLPLFAAVSLLCLFALSWIAGHLYYRGTSAQMETNAGTKRARAGRVSYRRLPQLLSLTLREWRLTLRSPVYALNGLMMIIMGPLLILLPKLAGGAATISGTDMTFSDLIQSFGGAEWMSLGLLGLFAFLQSMNIAAFTTISREGPALSFLRMLPISPVRQTIAKLLFGYSCGALATLVMAATAVFALGMPILPVLAAAGASLLFMLAPLALSMLPDMIRPKLSWNTETEAIKQNMNGVLGMFISVLYAVAAGVLCFFAIRGGMRAGVALLALCALSVLLAVFAVRLLCRVAVRSFEKLEG